MAMASPVENVAIDDVMAIRGVGAILIGEFPVLERVQLRAVCPAFLSAVDESLCAVSGLFWEDIADIASRHGGLTWLVGKCPNLQALSLWPRSSRTIQEIDHRREQVWRMGHRLVHPGMAASQSLLVGMIGHCTRLRYLNLAGCEDVDDDLLAAIAASCSELESIDISYCRVADQGIAALARLKGLKELSFSGLKGVSDVGVQAVATSCGQSLQFLDVTRTQVTDTALFGIALHCGNLRHLAVEDCRAVTDRSIQVVAEKCPGLRYLDVSGINDITDASITAIAARCPMLQGLALKGCEKVSGTTIEAVAEHCSDLEHISLWGLECPTIVMVRMVTNCHRLQLVDIDAMPVIDDDIIKALAANCPSLRHLSISQQFGVTDEGIISLAERCHELEHLGVSLCVGVTDAGICALARHCPLLRHLDVQGCSSVTDIGMSAVGENCRQLEELKISLLPDAVTAASLSVVAGNCNRLHYLDIYQVLFPGDSVWAGPALRLILKSCGQLKHLGIRGNGFPFDDCVAATSGNCTPLLRSFSAVGNRSVSDRGIASLLSGPAAAQLRQLDMSWNEDITDASLVVVGQACPQLRILNLDGSKFVTDAGIKAIAVGCRRLAFLDIRRCTVTRDALDMIDMGKCEVVWE